MASGSILMGLLIFVIFAIGAGLMISRRLPALLALPIMGVALALGAWGIQRLGLGGEMALIDLRSDILKGVVAKGAGMLVDAMIAAFFGGMLSFIMQKSGVAESMIKHGAELIGDNPLGVAFFSMLLVATIFTTIGGLGAIIMVAIVVLPMLATVGVPPLVAGGILLFGLSMGGLMNAQNWVLYVNVLGLPQDEVRVFAMLMFVLLGFTGLVFIIVELLRARALQSKRQAALMLIISGAVSFLLIGGIIVSHGEAAAPLPVFEQSFATEWEPGEGIRLAHEDGRLVAEMPAAVQPDSAVPLLRTEGVGEWLGRKGFEGLSKRSLSDFQEFIFNVRANFDGKLVLHVVDDTGAEKTFERPFKNGSILNFGLPVGELQTASLENLRTADFSVIAADVTAAGAEPLRLAFSQARYTVVAVVPMWLKGLRALFGAFILFLLGSILRDLLARVKYWRKQVVVVKWYAYLIPALPLGMIIIFDMDVNAALALGFTYAVLATLRPGSVSMAVQSMIQGSSSVLPAVLLMIGIGILVQAVIGPTGFAGEWPLTASMRPLLLAALPKNPIMFVIVFGICAPLALYRGPLNMWGLGFGVAALFLAVGAIPAAAIMAMLLAVGQIQGICDPTNTHNVWIANELRVDVQALMFRTLPYVWGMVVAGLALGAVMYF
ncbi:MAG: hypothetical protein PWP23_1113 [Candidatus Sumerlaeota bacterium]|nr:hypothetical protein [Candidatus Sumerlaeota bacterium]